jgi:hypothetical protein
VKRPFTALSVLGAAAHNLFELGAGVGLVRHPSLVSLVPPRSG